MEKMNKNIENMRNQIVNTLDVLNRCGYIDYYNNPGIFYEEESVIISWNNHQGGREVSGKAFLKVAQYLKIVSDKAYFAILKDYSLIRCSFKYNYDGKLLSENLLWWPCPLSIDPDMVEEFVLVETIELLMDEPNTQKYLRMRSPVRIDFDSENDKENHPGAHMHIQHEECRINTQEPICFNRCINHVMKNYYPDWDVSFRREDYLNINYAKRRKIQYVNTTEMIIGY